MTTTTNTPTDTLKRGDEVRTIGESPETATVVRGEWLNHPAYTDRDGIVPARRERWVHIRFADGGRILAHPSNLVRQAEQLSEAVK